MHVNEPTDLSKSALRILGIAESTPPSGLKTILAGVIMRGDLIIDGFHWKFATISGLDATEAIIHLFQNTKRVDIGGIMVHGSVIARYNMIDLSHLHQVTNLPVISVTKEPHEDLRQHLQSTFPDDWQKRWTIARNNGPLQPLRLSTGSSVHVQFRGAPWDRVQGLVNRLTRFGGMPEPIRVARLLARSLAKTH